MFSGGSLSGLPEHSLLIESLRREVTAGETWRWMELSCSLAAGRGDELSDIDVGVGHTVPDAQLLVAGSALVEAIGNPLDVLAHSEGSWPAGILRFAVEYDSGVQLDLVVMPAAHRPGLPGGSVALVDKDSYLAESWIPPVVAAASSETREWAMLGWWALSNVAKYVRRDSLFEAVQALQEARIQTLRLFAASREVPYPSFGLTALLDFEPFELPVQLDATYSTPSHPEDVLDAAWALVDLLGEVSVDAGNHFGVTLTTPWADIARARLRMADARLSGE